MMSQDSISLSRKQFTKLVSMLTGLAGYPDPENPLEPGPWDPVIFDSILSQVDLTLAGPQPQPWRWAGPQPTPWRHYQEQVLSSLNWRSLNPQPLPPRETWGLLAAKAIVADIQRSIASLQLWPEEFQERAIAGIQGNLAQLVDDWCPTPPRRFPIPIPPFPEPDPRQIEVNPLDLIMMGVVFDTLTRSVSERVQGALQETAVAFQNAGLERL